MYGEPFWYVLVVCLTLTILSWHRVMAGGRQCKQDAVVPCPHCLGDGVNDCELCYGQSNVSRDVAFGYNTCDLYDRMQDEDDKDEDDEDKDDKPA